MVIVVNARFLLANKMEGYGNYIESVCIVAATLLPQHQFYFVLDRPNENAPNLPVNAQYKIIGPQARHPILWYYWYNFKLTNFCKKVKAKIIIQPDGFCSLFTNIKQITVIHDVAFLHYGSFINKSHLWFYKNFTPKFIQKSNVIVTVSEFSKQEIIKFYNTPSQKIHIITNAANHLYKALEWQDQIKIKEKYTNGIAYFISVCSIHPRKNIVNLLKAFSIFKKFTKSNMQLILIGRLAWKNKEFEKLLNTYKYKTEVKILGYLPSTEVAQLVASAYAMVYPSVYEGFGVPIIEAMQCEVPVITNNSSGMLEAGGNAAFYADTTNINALTTQMQLCYKNENLRSEKIKLGLLHNKKFNWKNSATKMVVLIEEVLKD